MAKRKKKRQAPKGLPGRYLISKSGRSISYIIVSTETFPGRGDIYRLRSLLYDTRASDKAWTEADLRATGRICKTKPSAERIKKARDMPAP